MNKLHLLAATALSFAFAAPAFAQEAPEDAQPATSPSQRPQDFVSANEIVVTATRRNETVQEVPVAITALDDHLLKDAGVEDVRDLEQLAPSLQTTTGQSSATGVSIWIRGIGTAADNPGFEPAVGVFIDGVFRARSGIAVAELPELERVELLRGPQGTLFGRNTSAGALSITTKGPQFDPAAYVEGSYGNYNAWEVNGMVTGPITDKLAVRLDGGRRMRDGYIKDANSDRRFNDIDRYYVRGQALYDTADFSVRVIGDYSNTDEDCCGAVSAIRGPLAPVIQTVAGLQGLTGLYTGDPSDRTQAVSPNRDYGERVKDWGVSAEVNAALGDFNLTSITAYRDWRARRNQDIDFSGIDRAYRDGYRTSINDFTQELRLQSTLFGGKLDFLIGGFYLNETLKLHDVVQFGNDANAYVDTIFAGSGGFQFYGSYGVPTLPALGAALLGGPALPANQKPLLGQLLYLQSPALQAAAAANPALAALLLSPLPGVAAGQGNNPDNFRVDTDAWAVFTHNIVHVTDRLALTLGARFNHERKKLDASIFNNTGACGLFYSNDPAAAIYRNAVQSALGPNNYANFFLLSCNPAVNTEFNGNYADRHSENRLTGTAKLSYDLTDHALAYFSYDRGYKSGGYNLDQATFDSVLLGGNGPQASDLHFGSETVDAYEFGLKNSISREFTLNVALFYQKIHGYQSLDFSGTNFVVQNVDKATSKGVEVEAIIQPVREFTLRLGYTRLAAYYDRSNDFAGTPLAGQEGEQFGNQPKNVVTAALTYTPRLTDRFNALFHVDMRYNSEVTLDAGARTMNPGYALVNARVGLSTNDQKYSLEFFVENLTNQYYNVTGFAVPEQTGNYAVYPGPPRFFGVRAHVGF